MTDTTTNTTTPNTNNIATTQTTTAANIPGVVSTTPGQLPGTTLTGAQMGNIEAQNVQNVTNPTLPTGGTATPVNQQANQNEMLTHQTVDPSLDQVNQNIGVQASTVGSVATANQAPNIQAAQYNAVTVDPAQLASATQAVTATLPPNALVSNQLQQLLTPDANGNLPSWVQPAVTAANQLLSGRGISNSSMAGQAITAAILTAAIPVASANANAELTAWQQNLNNQQQAALQYGQEFTNAALSNQGAANAAANFNATSDNQTNQFLGSLAAQINQFNASQVNAITQFNATQTQSAATNTAQLQSQLQEFNANMANQREQFNVQNALIVQQSNAEYLRAVNTANTAVANQDNQLNAQNSMNISDQAMANLQQQFNDEATMLYNSNMTAEEQSYSLTYLSQQYGLQNQLDQNITDAQEGQALQQQIGTLAGNLFAPLASAAGQAVGSVVNAAFTGGSSNPNPPPTIPGATSGTGTVTGTVGLPAGFENVNGTGTAATGGLDSGGSGGGSVDSGSGASSSDFSFFDPTTWF